MDIIGNIIVAVLALFGSLYGTYKANNTNQAMIAYRLEQLEKKVNAHNNLVERMTVAEGRLTEAEHDIRDLKGRLA